MNIVCAQSVSASEKLFSEFGHVTVIPDASIRRDHLLSADALIIRSQTKITSALIENTPIKFIGTATSGIDHIDEASVYHNNITLKDAKGANAQAVAEYVLVSLLLWANTHDRLLSELTIGIIGYGCVGQRVHALLQALGVTCLLSDLPRHEAGSLPQHHSIESIANACDVITLHVPLIKKSPYMTRQLINPAFFAQCHRKPLIINTARGEVLDYEALLFASNIHQIAGYIADVFPDEPAINLRYIEQAYIATPHIAGYSALAKLKGSYVIYRAFAEYLGQLPVWSFEDLTANMPAIYLTMPTKTVSFQDALMQILLQIFDCEALSQSMKIGLQSSHRIAPHFQALRQKMSMRCEFSQGILTQAFIDKNLIDTLILIGCQST
jgi:erythronate-4-phosphate dehydrogenase